MKTLLTFTMTPTEPMITVLAGTLIIVGVALLITYILLHQARTERKQAIRSAMMWADEASKLKKELDSMLEVPFFVSLVREGDWIEVNR